MLARVLKHYINYLYYIVYFTLHYYGILQLALYIVYIHYFTVIICKTITLLRKIFQEIC